MLKEETLQQREQRLYEEPDGEYLELIESGNNTITVLTRVDSEKGGEEETETEVPPINPEGFTVTDLEEELTDHDWSDDVLRGLLEVEQEGKDRATAKAAIEDELE